MTRPRITIGVPPSSPSFSPLRGRCFHMTHRTRGYGEYLGYLFDTCLRYLLFLFRLTRRVAYFGFNPGNNFSYFLDRWYSIPDGFRNRSIYMEKQVWKNLTRSERKAPMPDYGVKGKFLRDGAYFLKFFTERGRGSRDVSSVESKTALYLPQHLGVFNAQPPRHVRSQDDRGVFEGV